MPENTDRYRHYDREYNRPNRKWICGHSIDGKECPLGPSSCGNCQGASECLPIKKGERWYCTRPKAFGGECEGGPGPNGDCGCSLSPCQPVRSLREIRKLVSWGVAIFTAGFLLIVLSGEPRDAAINAGRLSKAHSGEGLDCSSCHTQTSAAELGKVADPHFLTERAFANSELCLTCHGGEIGAWATTARFAHGWTQERVIEKTAAAAEYEERKESRDVELAVWIASKGPLQKMGMEGELACATCHQEHHGANYDLTELTNQQCQVCHQKQFHGFSDGHPSFASTDYPYSRRTRLFFDHESHYLKHFDDGGDVQVEGYDPEAPFKSGESCAHCHVPDSNGEFMRLRSYEESCAGCHEESVYGGDPLTFFAVPALHEKKVEQLPGRWPSEGYAMNPGLRLLLSDATREAIAELPIEEDGTLPLSGDETGAVVETVALDIQDLFGSAWSDGTSTLVQRISETGFADEESASNMISGLSVDTIRNFLFPGIRWELGEMAFPEIDVDSMNAKLRESSSRSLGTWPERTTPSLTNLLTHLLSHRKEMEGVFEDLERFRDESGAFSFVDLKEATMEEVAAVETLSWNLRALFVEVRQNGAPFLEQFNALKGGILDGEPTEKLIDQVFRNAVRDESFMNAVEVELASFRLGDFPSAVAPPAPVATPVVSPGDQDDFGSDDDFGGGDDDFGTSEEKPAATADDDFGGGDDDFGASEEKAAATADDDFGGGDDDFGASEEKPAATADDDFGGGDDDFGASDEKPAATADDDFGGGDDDFGAPDEKPAATADDDFGGGDDDFGAPEEKPVAADDEFGAPEEKPEEKVAEVRKLPRSFEPTLNRWQKGGWYYEADGIHYESQGHADPVIKAWIEASVAALNSADANQRQNGRLVLNHVLQRESGVKTEASGKCFKCHTLDRDDLTGSYQVNWFEAYGAPHETNPSSELTRFSHVKHFIAVDCVSCHVIDEGGDYADFFPTRGSEGELSNPKLFVPNFKPINERESCVVCHQSGLSGENCLQCHDYHTRQP